MKTIVGKFIAETKKAKLVQFKNKEQKWIPKSVMAFVKTTKAGWVHFDVPTWFLAKNNITT